MFRMWKGAREPDRPGGWKRETPGRPIWAQSKRQRTGHSSRLTSWHLFVERAFPQHRHGGTGGRGNWTAEMMAA
eukprot:8887936-Pyramimonas_sp.AAC.1